MNAVGGAQATLFATIWVGGQIPKQDQRAIAEAIRQRISATDGAHAIAPPTAAHAPIDVADQLAKFAALRDQGVISDEEFVTQKSKLLGM